MAEQNKAELMRRLRKRRREAGLVKAEIYIKPEDRARVAMYIKRLGGEYSVKA